MTQQIKTPEEWLGEEALHHIETMYPGLWEHFTDTSKRSLKNYINNEYNSNKAEAEKENDALVKDVEKALNQVALLQAEADKLREENQGYRNSLNDAESIAHKLAVENVKLSDFAKRAVDSLISIEEYWNGGSESAVDAAEEMRTRASAILTDPMCVEVMK